ncbi:SDR family NAD(P)-dependent oxidoreductase [Dankookia rubra]|uniref:SDR family NAD(P)-dependent oxidoreductase n=1 Tax=Dankookia rubra TaxID=1442381 RepID=UPI0034DE4355
MLGNESRQIPRTQVLSGELSPRTRSVVGNRKPHRRGTFERVIRTNLAGCFVTAQAAARAMVWHGQGGRIVTTSSVSG